MLLTTRTVPFRSRTLVGRRHGVAAIRTAGDGLDRGFTSSGLVRDSERGWGGARWAHADSAQAPGLAIRRNGSDGGRHGVGKRQAGTSAAPVPSYPAGDPVACTDQLWASQSKVSQCRTASEARSAENAPPDRPTLKSFASTTKLSGHHV